MNIVFNLKDGSKVERFGCNENDMTKLVSQFNNGHLMRVENFCVNPKEVVSFIGYGSEG